MTVWELCWRGLLEVSLAMMALSAWERLRMRWLHRSLTREPSREPAASGVLRHSWTAVAGYALLALTFALAALTLPGQRLLATLLGVASLVGAIRYHASEIRFDSEAVERWWFGQRWQRLSWSQLRRVEASQGTLVLAESEGPALQIHYSRAGFDSLCACVLQRASAQARISGEASLLLLGWARLPLAALIRCYGPRFVAEPRVHGYLWDPDVDPYESWRVVATTLGQRLAHSLGQAPGFLVTLDALGRATVRACPDSDTVQGRTWAYGCTENGQLRIEVNYDGHGVRRYLQPI